MKLISITLKCLVGKLFNYHICGFQLVTSNTRDEMLRAKCIGMSKIFY